ncbi:MAG TPA: hypothetical protein PKD64_07890 [Pirellulaceae bacterium]|nr:hypothetical protein [Pirellulaceae bacterium]HMO92108.1 hypothetical protein [Pirellulaceae bacterium]HMP69304.1 hypothetical protein [Pirellulaceae bacterium]
MTRLDAGEQFENASQESGKFIPILLATVVVSATLYLIWPLLFSGRILSYRDAGYLYYPLFEFVQNEWESRKLPLWNPYCGYGQPLLADGTPSVFYPLKLIFFVQAFPITTRLGLYTLIHLWLAAAGIYRCGRTLRLGQEASAIATICFVFCAPFLSLANNVVYLIGAAWLPWFVSECWKMGNPQEGVRRLTRCAILSAMMVLGGDPQMAYHAILIAALIWSFQWLSRRSQKHDQERDQSSSKFSSFCLKTSCRLGALAAMTFGLAAIQILPSWEANRSSVRSMFEYPHNVTQIPAYLLRPEQTGISGVVHGFLATPWPEERLGHQVISHQSDRYQFSLNPLSMVEIGYPDFNHDQNLLSEDRWFNTWVGPKFGLNDRCWYPSLYCGILTWVLVFVGIGFLSKRTKQVWECHFLTCLSLLFLFGSLGIFGLGSFISDSEGMGIGEQVGGVYWFFSSFLPGYASFRYPAKLLIIACFGCSLLAGFGWGRLQYLNYKVVAWVLAIPAGLAVIAMVVAVLNYFGAGENPDSLHGVTRLRVVHALAVILVLVLVAIVIRSRPVMVAKAQTSRMHRVALSLLLFSLASELVVANSWLLHTTKIGSTNGVENIDEADALAQEVNLMYQTRAPKFHLLSRTNQVFSFSSLERGDWAFFLEQMLTQNSEFWYEAAKPDPYISEKVKLVEPIDERSPLAVSLATMQIFDESATLIETRKFATQTEEVIETESGNAEISGNDLAIYPRDRSNLIRLDVQLERAAWVVVPEQFASGWHGRAKKSGNANWRPVEIHRADRVMLAFYLTPGRYQVELTYLPQSFLFGFSISAIFWLAVPIALKSRFPAKSKR